MQTETGVKGDARVVPRIASQAAARVAIGQATRSAVVASAYNAELAHQHAAHAPLHAVTPVGCQLCQLHKVGVPTWAKAGFVREVERLERVMEEGEGRGRIEEAKLGAMKERSEPRSGGVEVLIVSEDEFG